jgi:AdoMet-dependent rRNA methyltransferase SPB1
MHLYKEINLTNFIDADNPFPVFMDYNKMIVSQEEKDKYFGLAKLPEDFNHLVDDLKVLGKRDVSILLKWRGKIKQALYKQTHLPKNKDKHGKDIDSEEELEK